MNNELLVNSILDAKDIELYPTEVRETINIVFIYSIYEQKKMHIKDFNNVNNFILDK